MRRGDGLEGERTAALLGAIVHNLNGGDYSLWHDSSILSGEPFFDARNAYLFVTQTDVVATPVALVHVGARPGEDHDKEEQAHAESHVHEVAGRQGVGLREAQPGGGRVDAAGASPFVVAVDDGVLIQDVIGKTFLGERGLKQLTSRR